MGIVLAIGELDESGCAKPIRVKGGGVNQFAMPYSAFEDELLQVGLYHYFYTRCSDRTEPIVAQHPGVTDLSEHDVDVFKQVRSTLAEPSCLVNWLCFWSDWALTNLSEPVITNH